VYTLSSPILDPTSQKFDPPSLPLPGALRTTSVPVWSTSTLRDFFGSSLKRIEGRSLSAFGTKESWFLVAVLCSQRPGGSRKAFYPQQRFQVATCVGWQTNPKPEPPVLGPRWVLSAPPPSSEVFVIRICVPYRNWLLPRFFFFYVLINFETSPSHRRKSFMSFRVCGYGPLCSPPSTHDRVFPNRRRTPVQTNQRPRPPTVSIGFFMP